MQCKHWYHDVIKPFMDNGDMQRLKQFIEERRKVAKVYPEPTDIYNAYKLCPYEKTRVIVLGQDPYHTPGTAHGLSFSSLQKSTPPSLLNIFKEIKRSIYPSIPIESLFTSNNLTHWANQGVLLINTVLTVEEGLPASHKGKGWESLTTHVFKELNNHPNNLVFMLWGNFAKSFKQYITDPRHLVLESVHPSPMNGNAFLGNNHFYTANIWLDYNSPDFINLFDCIDQSKAKEKIVAGLKQAGKDKPDFEKIKAVYNSDWFKIKFGVWIGNEESNKGLSRRIEWTT